MAEVKNFTDSLVGRREWADATDVVAPHVVRLQTPAGSGTGFLFHKTSGLVAIATAAHVVDYAHYWEQPIRIHHGAESVLVRVAERAILLVEAKDTAAILVLDNFKFPEVVLSLGPEDQHVRVGVEIGWLGYPAVAGTQLCFFGGRVSAEQAASYLVDGVAINGVSGGPAFHFPSSPVLMGVLSAYIPNRATGEALPGLAVVRDVSHLHDMVKRFKSLEDAKGEETTPAQPPGPPPDQPKRSTGQAPAIENR